MVKLIYLAAAHNSGSTVISVLANSHPEVVSPGEMMGPGRRKRPEGGHVCSCGETFAQCNFWQMVVEVFRGRGYSWDADDWGLKFEQEGSGIFARLPTTNMHSNLLEALRDRSLKLIPSHRRRIRLFQERNTAFAEAIAGVAQKSVVLDASKHPHRLRGLLDTPGLDLYLVHLVRDPRGWCYSRKRGRGDSVVRTSPRWVRINRHIERLSRLIPPNRRLLLRYEDFCEDPDKAFCRMTGMVGLPAVTLPDDLQQIEHHVMGNRMRLRGDRKVTLDLTWRDVLTPQECRVIKDTTQELAGSYGYTFD